MCGKSFSLDSLRQWLNSYEEDRLNNRNYIYRIKSALKKISIWLGFHAAIRYFPLVSHIKDSGIQNPGILEVGSGPIGITHYLKEKVIGIDNNPRVLKVGTLQLIKGQATSLPFKDTKFDFTISVDFLEHISPPERRQVISEMIRVTKGDILIAVPCGEETRKRERKVKDIYEEKIKLWHSKELAREAFIRERGSFLLEHEKMGLPDENELIRLINESLTQAKRHYRIEIINNESLWVWYHYVLTELRYNYFRWFITTVLAFFLLPLLKRMKFGGCYRKIFIIKHEANG